MLSNAPFDLKNGAFQQYFEFDVNNMQDDIAIYLESVSTTRRMISGFPTTISALQNSQGLSAVFGKANHRKRVYAEAFTNPRTVPNARKKRNLNARRSLIVRLS
jgi:hypothetical protein